jgi:2-iminobutanoate/2-iminopropanoate deaminase
VCYLSGQGGLDPATGEVVEGGIRPETKQTMRNIEAVLAAGGMTLSDVVTVTCNLVDIDEWPAMNEVYAAHFDDSRPYPARTAVAVAALPSGMRVEMTVTAVLPAGPPPLGRPRPDRSAAAMFRSWHEGPDCAGQATCVTVPIRGGAIGLVGPGPQVACSWHFGVRRACSPPWQGVSF